MNNRGFRGRGFGPRGGPGNNASAGAFSGPRFPHPNFRPLRPLLNRPAGPRTWLERPPHGRPFLHWQSDGITHFPNFPRHSLPFRHNAPQFRPNSRGRPPNVRGGGHFSANVTPFVSHDYEPDTHLGSEEPQLNKDEVPDSLSSQVPLPGSEEERQQKIFETANRLKQKLSSISKENMISFWEDDFSVLKPTCSKKKTESIRLPSDLKCGSPELDLTFNDFKDIGRVQSDNILKGDTSDDTDCILVLPNEGGGTDRTSDKIIVTLDNDDAVEQLNLANNTEACSTKSQTIQYSDLGKFNELAKCDSKRSRISMMNDNSAATSLQSQELTQKLHGCIIVSDNTTEHNCPKYCARHPHSASTEIVINDNLDKTHHGLHILPHRVHSDNCSCTEHPDRTSDADIVSSSSLVNSQENDLNQSMQIPSEHATSQRTADNLSNSTSKQKHIVRPPEKTVKNQEQSVEMLSSMPILPFNFDASVPPPNSNLSHLKEHVTGNRIIQSVVCHGSKSKISSNCTHGNNGDLLKSSLGFDPHTPPPTFGQKSRSFNTVKPFHSQNQPPSSCSPCEYLQPPLIFDPRLSSEERSSLLAHVSTDALRSSTVNNTDLVTGFDGTSVTTNLYQLPPTAQPMTFQSEMQMNYLPILPHTTQGTLQNITTSPPQFSSEYNSQALDGVGSEHLINPHDLDKKKSQHVNNELEDMQEAMEFAKQVMSMSDQVNNTVERNISVLPELSPLVSSTSTSSEKICHKVVLRPDLTLNPKTLLSSKGRKSNSSKCKTDAVETCNFSTKKVELVEESKRTGHTKMSETQTSMPGIKNDALLKTDQFRCKVTFNLRSKVRKIHTNKWQEKMKENGKRARDMSKTKMLAAKEATGRSKITHDASKTRKNCTERNSDIVKIKENSCITNCSEGQDSSVAVGLTNLVPTGVRIISGDKLNIENTEVNSHPIATQKLQSTNTLNKKAHVSVQESSWKNRVINRFLKMSKNDICNMVNSSSLRKFDIAMKHLVKEKRSSLSLEMRSTEEEKIKNYDREEFMNQLNAMLDPSAVVDISNLPTEFIHHLSEVLQLDPMPLDADQPHSEFPAISPFSHETIQDDVIEIGTQNRDCESTQSQSVFHNICEDSAKKRENPHESHIPPTSKLDADTQIEGESKKPPQEVKANNARKTSGTMFNMVDLDDIFSEVVAKAQNVSLDLSGSVETSAASEKTRNPTSKRSTDDTGSTRGTVVELEDMFSRDVGEEKDCSSQVGVREWARCDQDDSLAFRNLTKEEWEAKYGSRESIENERRGSEADDKTNCPAAQDQPGKGRESQKNSSTGSSKRRPSISPSKFHSEKSFSEREFLYSNEEPSFHRNHRMVQISDSSSSSSSTDTSSDSSDQSSEEMPMDVVKLLKVIKEKEKIAKTRTLSETLRDEISAEIERGRNERGRHRERKSRKRERKKKEKKGKRRKQKMKRRKKVTDPDSPNESNADSQTRLLTENEIKKESPVESEKSFVAERQPDNSEVIENIHTSSRASERTDSRGKSPAAFGADATSKTSTQTPTTVPPLMQLKTKAQLKQMPETSEIYVAGNSSGRASTSPVSKLDDASTEERESLDREKSCNAAKTSVSTTTCRATDKSVTNEDVAASESQEQAFSRTVDARREIAVEDVQKSELPAEQRELRAEEINDVNVTAEKVKNIPSCAVARANDDPINVLAEQDNSLSLLEKYGTSRKEEASENVAHNSTVNDSKGFAEPSKMAATKSCKKLDIETYKKRMLHRKFIEQEGAKRAANKLSSLTEVPVCAIPSNVAKSTEDAAIEANPETESGKLHSSKKDVNRSKAMQITGRSGNDKCNNLCQQQYVRDKKTREEEMKECGDERTIVEIKKGRQSLNIGMIERGGETRGDCVTANASTEGIFSTLKYPLIADTASAKSCTPITDDVLKIQATSNETLSTDAEPYINKFKNIRSEGGRELKLKKENAKKESKMGAIMKEHNLQKSKEEDFNAIDSAIKKACLENIKEMENDSLINVNNVVNIPFKRAEKNREEKNKGLQHITDKIMISDSTDLKMQKMNCQKERDLNGKARKERQAFSDVRVEIAACDVVGTLTDTAENFSEDINDVHRQTDAELNDLSEENVNVEKVDNDSCRLPQKARSPCNTQENYETALDNAIKESSSNCMTTLEANETTASTDKSLSRNLTNSPINEKRSSLEDGCTGADQILVKDSLEEEQIEGKEADTLYINVNKPDESSDHQNVVCSPVNSNVLSPESSNSPFKGFSEESSACTCTKQSNILDINLEIDVTEKDYPLENENVILNSSMSSVHCERRENDDVPFYKDFTDETNAQLTNDVDEFDENQSQKNLTPDEKTALAFDTSLVNSPVKKESSLVIKSANSRTSVEHIGNEESSAEKLLDSCKQLISDAKSNSHQTAFSLSIPLTIFDSSKTNCPRIEALFNKKENNGLYDDTNDTNVTLRNVQTSVEEETISTGTEDSVNLSCNKADEHTLLTDTEMFTTKNQSCEEHRREEDITLTVTTSDQMNKSNNPSCPNSSETKTKSTSDKDIWRQRSPHHELIEDSSENLKRNSCASDSVNEERGRTSSGSDVHENSSNKYLNRNDKKAKSSKLHGVKNKQPMKNKPEKKYNISKENIQIGIQSDMVNFASKETIISRMIEIDVEIHKLMMEKMTLYKLLENQSLSEGISPDSSTPSEDKKKEMINITPAAPVVISQLIKNTDMTSTTSLQDNAIKTENISPKKHDHKSERANVDKLQSEQARRKRSEEYFNLSSEDDDLLQCTERKKSLSPNKRKRRKMESAPKQDNALKTGSCDNTQSAEVDRKTCDPKSTSKRNQLLRNVKHQKTGETDNSTAASEALNENVIDSTNNFIGWKNQNDDSDNLKTKPSSSTTCLATAIYSDESTLDSPDQGSASAKSDSKKSTGLALLEESFKREMAASRKLKTVARRKKKKQIKSLLSTVNNLTVEEEELPLNKLYIKKLEQKRDLLVSLNNPTVISTAKALTMKTEDESKHAKGPVDVHEGNRVANIHAKSNDTQSIDNSLEKVSSTQMEDDECVSIASKFTNNSMMEAENVDTNCTFLPSQTRSNSETSPLLADVVKSSEDVNANISGSHLRVTISEEREPVGSTQVDHLNEMITTNRKAMDNDLEGWKLMEETKKDAWDDSKSENIQADHSSVVSCSRNNANIGPEEKDVDNSLKCKGIMEKIESVHSKVNENTTMPEQVAKSDAHLSRGSHAEDSERSDSPDINSATNVKQFHDDKKTDDGKLHANEPTFTDVNKPTTGPVLIASDEVSLTSLSDRDAKDGERLTESLMVHAQRESECQSDKASKSPYDEGSRPMAPFNQERRAKLHVASRSPRPASAIHETAENAAALVKRRVTTRKPQVVGASNKKRTSCGLTDTLTDCCPSVGGDQETQRKIKKRKHSKWEMMNCKVRLVDSKYTILRPDVNRDVLRQLGISTINPYVRRKYNQEDSASNLHKGNGTQEARLSEDSEVAAQITRHKNYVESLHATHCDVSKPSNTTRDQTVQNGGQSKSTRSKKSRRQSLTEVVECFDSKSSAKDMDTDVAINTRDKTSVGSLLSCNEQPEIEILEEKMKDKERSECGEDIPKPCDSNVVEEVEQPRRQYTVHKGPILDIKIFNDSFLAASEDGMIYRYSQTSNGLLNVYKGHKAAVTCLYIHKSNSTESTREWIYSGALDGTLRCYNIMSGVEMREAIQIGSPIQCMDQAWGIIFIGTKSGHVSRFYMKSNDVRGDTIQFSDKSVLALKATNEGPRKVLIVASRNQPITIRDAQTGLFLRIICGQRNHTVYSLMRDHNLIYCGTSSTSIPVFDFTNGEQTMQYNAGVGIVCMRLYQQFLFAGCYDGNIYVFDTRDRRLVCSIPGPGNMLLSMEIIRYKIIAGSKDKHLQSWLMPKQVRDLLNKR